MNQPQNTQLEHFHCKTNARNAFDLSRRPYTRVMLADDDARLRSALQFRLEHEPGIRVVGEATDVGSLLAKAEARLPDILLMDWELPGLTVAGAGKQLLRILRLWFPQLKVIALSSLPEAKAAALVAQVDAFVSKAEPADHLVELCRKIYQEAG